MTQAKSGFQRRKEQKKASIRQAAMELFSQYGFDKVSINDIANRARVSHVTIYNHFGSKDELVQDIAKTAITNMTDKIREVIYSEELPFLEKLELIISNKAMIGSHYEGQLMQVAISHNPEMHKFIESLWDNEVTTMTKALVNEGKQLGYIDKDLSQEAILYYFEIFRRGGMAISDLLGKAKPDEKLVRDLNRIAIFGVVHKKE